MKQPNTPVDIDAHGVRFVIYHLQEDEGQPLHQHDYEHGILIVSGQVALGTDDGEQNYSAPCLVFAAARKRHSFRAVGGPAVVINTIEAKDLVSKVYL
jgi:quercetin dioxygenase-like cupin family protein